MLNKILPSHMLGTHVRYTAKTISWEKQAFTSVWVSAFLGKCPSDGRLGWCWAPRWLPGSLSSQVTSWLSVASLLGLGLYIAATASCGHFPSKGFTVFYFCSSFGLLLFCIASDLAAKTMDFMPVTVLKRQIQYLCICTFFKVWDK